MKAKQKTEQSTDKAKRDPLSLEHLSLSYKIFNNKRVGLFNVAGKKPQVSAVLPPVFNIER
jgi:hypothetical protein